MGLGRVSVDYTAKERNITGASFLRLYAGGKYNNLSAGGTYQYSLGINGLGMCATQYSSKYMYVEIFRDGYRYELNFEKGKPVGDMLKEPTTRKKTGSRIKWMPDLKVFTDIAIPDEYSTKTCGQSVVNAGLLLLRRETSKDRVKRRQYYYNRQ